MVMLDRRVISAAVLLVWVVLGDLGRQWVVMLDPRAILASV